MNTPYSINQTDEHLHERSLLLSYTTTICFFFVCFLFSLFVPHAFSNFPELKAALPLTNVIWVFPGAFLCFVLLFVFDEPIREEYKTVLADYAEYDNCIIVVVENNARVYGTHRRDLACKHQVKVARQYSITGKCLQKRIYWPK